MSAMVTGAHAALSAGLPHLADAALQATLLLGLLLAIGVLLRSAPASARHRAWAIGLAGVLTLPLLAPVTPWRIDASRVFPLGEVLVRSATGVAGAHDPPPLAGPPAEEGGAASTTGALPPIARAAYVGTPTPASPDSGPGMAGWIVLVWAIGALALITRLAAGFAAASWVAQRARVPGASLRRTIGRAIAPPDRARARIRISRHVDVPFTIGTIRPCIVMPASSSTWTEQRMRAVLLHELAHVRRADLVAHLGGRLACAIYWFHPLVWLVARRLRVDAERACDDAVLAAGVRASDYAQHLLEIVAAGRRVPPLPALAMADRNDFEGRLLSILAPRRAPSRSRWFTIGVATLLVAITGVVAGMTPVRTTLSRGAATANVAAADRGHGGRVPRDPRAVSALIAMLADADAGVRASAAEALGDMCATAAGPALTALLDDPESAVRARAARALGEIGHAVAVERLSVSVRDDPDRDVRRMAARALGESESAHAASALVSALRNDPHRDVRRAAAKALGEIGSTVAVHALAASVTDGDREVRRRALDGLAEIGTNEAWDVLDSALRSGDANVRKLAIRAIGRHR